MMENSVNKKRPTATTATPGECRICEAPALYSYFGAKSCDACKIFFRRNAEHGQVNFKYIDSI